MSDLYETTPGPSPEDCVLINTMLNSTSITSALERDIEQLCNNIDTINDLFDRVSRPLHKFDHEYFKDSNASGALAPQWVPFRKVSPRLVCRADLMLTSVARHSGSTCMWITVATVLQRRWQSLIVVIYLLPCRLYEGTYSSHTL